MAKTKRSTGKRKKKVKHDAYLQAIVIIIFSIVFAILIYGQTGSFGRGLSNVLGGLMGWIKYIVPVGTFIVGIILTKEQKEFVMPKIIQYVVIILCVCGFMSLIQLSTGELSVNGEFSNTISLAYDEGVTNRGGGAIRSINCNTYDEMHRRSIICSINWSCYTSYDIYIWNKASRTSRQVF